MHTNTVFFHHLNGGQNFLSSIVHCVSCLLNFTFEFVLSNKSTVTVNINAKVLHLLYRTDQKLTLVVIVFSILKSTQILWPHIMAVSSLLFISSLISFLVGRTTPSSEVFSGKEKNMFVNSQVPLLKENCVCLLKYLTLTTVCTKVLLTHSLTLNYNYLFMISSFMCSFNIHVSLNQGKKCQKRY